MEWAYTIAGLAVGFIVGVTGMGGGALMTPLLILLFNISPAMAIGTDLLFAAITKAGGVWVHGRRGHVEWKIVRLLAAGSLPAAALTVFWLDYYSGGYGGDTKKLLTVSLGIALLLTAPAVLFKSQLLRLAQSRLNLQRFVHWRTLATVIAGVIVGTLVTLSSVGAGVLGTVILFFLYPHMAAVRIVGTEIAHAVPLTAVAGLGHMHLGNVDFMLLGALLIGSLPGIYIGSHLSGKIPEKVLRPILGTVLLLFGARFTFS
ncbi:MAG: sulfite exporter TauE/SafE family protein [Gammaproteobacteria bacterium]|nr:sulfite exporter TauE/SafE family protein [Gammaproteobacteria bacterium]